MDLMSRLSSSVPSHMRFCHHCCAYLPPRDFDASTSFQYLLCLSCSRCTPLRLSSHALGRPRDCHGCKALAIAITCILGSSRIVEELEPGDRLHSACSKPVWAANSALGISHPSLSSATTNPRVMEWVGFHVRATTKNGSIVVQRPSTVF